MIDITHKSNSLRIATAEATVHASSEETIAAIREGRVPKGNVLEVARTAGLFAVKQTYLSIPDCHPLPVESTAIEFSIEGLEVTITIEVKTIYKTGVEVEAMHGASIVALTMYDMLKPIDKGVEIRNIRLLKKSGGKSDFVDRYTHELTAAVIVCSDSVSKGVKEDKAGLAVKEKLESMTVNVKAYEIIPDEVDKIQSMIHQHVGNGMNLLLFCGGTGLSPRDITPDAVAPLLDREVPGIMEAARKYGQDRTHYAMLSRSIAGVKDNTLILTLPGSSRGAAETMDAVFPAALHVFRILRGARHDS